MITRSASPRRVFMGLGILALALAVSALPPPTALAQQETTAQKAAPAQESAVSDLAPLPLSPVEKAEKDGTSLRLSLKDLTKLALQNNLDIAIQDTNEQFYQQRIIQAYGPYDPTLTAGLGYNTAKSPNTNLATASTLGAFNSSNRSNWNFGFTQNVPSGGGISANWNTNRSDNNQAFSLFTPQFSSSLSVFFTQPLRRNFRIDQYRSQIKLVNLDLQTNDSKFKQKVTETIANIQSQYWDLVAAIRDYDIKRDSVRFAQITLRDNKKKVEIGTLAPIGVTEAQASMAQREVDLISSEERIFNVENALRALISNDRNAEIWSKVIVPTETADFKEYKVDLDFAIDTALKSRPELEQFDLSLKQSDINLQLSENLRKWKVDLQAGFGSSGVAGPQSLRNGEPAIPDYLVGGVATAYRTIFSQGFTNWSVGFQVEIPLRNRNVESQLAQQKITRRQTLMQRKSTEQAIQVDIRNAVQKLETNRKQVETAKVGRQLAKEQLDGEEKRFQAGLSQNYLVLQRQNELAAAQFTELQSLINYQKSIIALQKSMYTLLESNDFEVAKGSSNNVPNLK
ncbi:MAG TPA: TolC family protein [Acidobacteriota bacterium]|nr:TolC family protein [Acidobacteriota bacterium]